MTDQLFKAIKLIETLEHDFRLAFRTALDHGMDSESFEMKALEKMLIEYNQCEIALKTWTKGGVINRDLLNALMHTSRSLVRDVIEPYEADLLPKEQRNEEFYNLGICFRNEVRLIVAANSESSND